MKIIAFYLPQFHNIPENDEWWGNGFTEWTNVKKAKPLYEGHMQPRVPLGGNYYNLLDDNVKIWQADLAKKYGVYGFCYYHYWFNGKMLLEKPMEQMLANKEVDIPFCICWANEPWTKAWVGDERKLLIAQEYGQEEEWKQHFMYLLPFFKDERYITKDGKPLFVFYRPDIVPCMKEMIETWDKLAKENGLSGITFAFQSGDYDWNNSKEAKLFDYDIEFQPPYASHWIYSASDLAGCTESLSERDRAVIEEIEEMGQIKVEKNVGGIEGLCVIEPAVHGDARGYFMETYNEKDMKEAGIDIHFVQDNQSMSTKGVLRGLHFQKQYPQCKLVRAVRGTVFDVAVDLRSDSTTYGKWYGVTLSAENKKQFLIPEGFAHGFLVLSDEAEFCYKVNDFWHPNDEP